VTRRLWTHRHLVASLVRRQVSIRYRQSFAGYVWAVVPPLATLGTATLVFHEVARVETVGAPYPLFTFAGLTSWSFFASSLTLGVPSVVSGYQMVQRFPFPRAVLPLSVIGTSLVDLAIALGAFVLFTYATGHSLTGEVIWFPVLLVIEIAFSIGVVLFACALNVFSRDIKLALPLGVGLLLFLTPVMYPLSAVPDRLRHWFTLNPMTGLVGAFRDILVFGHPPALRSLVPSIIGAAVALLVGAWYFGATESRFADVV